MMEPVKVVFGEMSLTAPPDWTFVPTENFVLARRDSQIGVLQITQLEVNSLPELSPSAILAAAQQLISKEPLPEPFQVKSPVANGYLFGAASFRTRQKGRDLFTRVIYLLRDDHLVVGVYGCPWKLRNHAAAHEELSQCEKMILTVQFSSPK